MRGESLLSNDHWREDSTEIFTLMLNCGIMHKVVFNVIVKLIACMRNAG